MTSKERRGHRNLKPFGLNLVWMSQIHQRERYDIVWYANATTRDIARKKFEKEKIGGKPKFIRIVEVQRD